MRKSSVCTLADLNPGFGGPWDMLWIFLGYGTFIMLQKKYRTRAIITRSRFETALDYKPRIFKVRKVSLDYKQLCNINRGLYNYQKLENFNSNCCKLLQKFSFSIDLQHLFFFIQNKKVELLC